MQKLFPESSKISEIKAWNRWWSNLYKTRYY